MEFFNVAKCTCPNDAAAMAVRLNVSKISSIGLLNSFSMIFTAISPENPGTLSCNNDNSSINSRGNISIRVDNSCPSLMKVGPNSSILLVNIFAMRRRFCLYKTSSFFFSRWTDIYIQDRG